MTDPAKNQPVFQSLGKIYLEVSLHNVEIFDHNFIAILQKFGKS